MRGLRRYLLSTVSHRALMLGLQRPGGNVTT